MEAAATPRERLLFAAYARLASGGYAHLQIAEVAREAGVATGTVYRHFPSKADLAIAVFRDAVEPELAAVAAAAAPGPPAPERLDAAVEAFVRRAGAAPRRAYALLAEPVGPELEVLRNDYRRAYARIFADVLRDGVAAGELAPCDPGVVASAIVGALGEALLGVLDRRSTLTPDELLAQLRAFVANAVAPRSPRVHA